MKNKILVIVVIMLMIFSLFTGCDSKQTIQVGFVGTLSGPTSEVATAGRRGVEIAIDMINASGGVDGRNIELIIKDSLNDIEIAKKVADEFIKENVQLVIGDFTSELTKSALEAINGKNIIYLSPTSSSNFFDEKDDNLLRFTGTSYNMVDAIIQQIMNDNNKNILVIKDESNKSFVDTFSGAFENTIVDYNGSVVEHVYFNSSLNIDEDSIINKLKQLENKIDGVLLLANASSTVSLVQIIRNYDMELDIYTSSWSNTADLLTLGGTYIEGIHTISAIDHTSTSIKYIEFADKYIGYYGIEPSIPAVFAYDTMMALYYGLLDSESVKAKDVKKSIIDIGAVEGLQNSFEIDEYGDSRRNFMQFIVEDQKIVIDDKSILN